MNYQAMADVLKEACKDLRIKIDRTNSIIGDGLVLNLVDEKGNFFLPDITGLCCLGLENATPSSFLMFAMKNNPNFIDLICRCICGEL